MIYATVISLCAVLCDDYIIDTANYSTDATINKIEHSQEWKSAWDDDKQLQVLLDKYKTGLNTEDVQTYFISTQSIKNQDIP